LIASCKASGVEPKIIRKIANFYSNLKVSFIGYLPSKVFVFEKVEYIYVLTASINNRHIKGN